MLDIFGLKLMKLRHVVRLCVTVGCCMLFALLMLQDVKMYIQSIAHQGSMVLSQYTWDDYSAIPHKSHASSADVQIDQIDTERYRVTRKTLGLHKDNTDAEREQIPEKLDSERYRLTRFVNSQHTHRTTSNTSYCGQEPRQALMSRTCDWLKENNHPLTNIAKFKVDMSYTMIFVDDKRKLLYCEVPKVACTSWKVLFANLSGKVDPKDYSRLHELVHDTTYYPKVGFKYLNQYTPEERQYRLQHYYKFLVVRNPFSRIISAWENKFYAQTQQSKWYHDMVGKYIIKKYRKNASNESLSKGSDVRFEELVKLIADPNEQIRSRFDPHWWNIHSICYPCLFSYDYIAKLETIEQDIENLLEHISPKQHLKLPYLNANTKSRKLAEQAKIQAFFHNVPESDSSKLTNNIYNVDLKSFGYSMSDNSLECQLNYTP